MNKAFLLIPLVLVTVSNVDAQSVGPATLNAAGNTAIIGANEFDWSVGEMTMVSTFSNSGLIVTQGVLQPPDKDIAGVVTSSAISTLLHVFPNPATSVLNIQYLAGEQAMLSYKLVDMTGKVILTRSKSVAPGAMQEQIDVTGLACATYVLEVIINADGALPATASYKIQKLK